MKPRPRRVAPDVNALHWALGQALLAQGGAALAEVQREPLGGIIRSCSGCRFAIVLCLMQRLEPDLPVSGKLDIQLQVAA